MKLLRKIMFFAVVFHVSMFAMHRDKEKGVSQLLLYSVINKGWNKKLTRDDILELMKKIKDLLLTKALHSDSWNMIRMRFEPCDGFLSSHSGFAVNIEYKGKIDSLWEWLLDSKISDLKTKNGFSIRLNRYYSLEQWPYSDKTDWVEVNMKDFLQSQTISFTDSGQGKPIVLIHAFPTDLQLWQEQQKGLKNHFRVITLDLWGFGQSAEVSGQAITMTEYADEVKQLLDQLHLNQAIIGGESMGGYVALAFYEKYPDHVSGLILSGTQSIADSDLVKERREAIARDILENGTANFIGSFISSALSPHATNQTKQFLQIILERQKPNGMVSALRGMALRGCTSALLPQSNLPILIIAGNLDAIIPLEQSKAMHSIAKNSTLVILANAGHLSNLEQPEQWNQAVISKFTEK